METKTARQAIGAMMECVQVRTITPPPPPVDQAWLDKWIRLRAHHPKLKLLEAAIWEFCCELARSPNFGRLLVIAGDNGTGKTHAARAVFRWATNLPIQYVNNGAIKSFGLNVVFWRWPELLDQLKGGAWDIIEDCMGASLLILDELGGGHDPSSVGTDKLCQILSRRETQWTVVTTNIVPAFWETKFDRRVASRFMRQSTIIDLSDVADFSTL